MDGLEGKIPIKNMMIILGTPISGNLHISKETTMLPQAQPLCNQKI